MGIGVDAAQVNIIDIVEVPDNTRRLQSVWRALSGKISIKIIFEILVPSDSALEASEVVKNAEKGTTELATTISKKMSDSGYDVSADDSSVGDISVEVLSPPSTTTATEPTTTTTEGAEPPTSGTTRCGSLALLAAASASPRDCFAAAHVGAASR